MNRGDKKWTHFLQRIFLGENFDKFSTLRKDFDNQNFEMFKEFVSNFCKFVGDII